MQNQEKRRRAGGKRGFTVIEVVTVFALVAVLAVVAVPVIQPVLRQVRLDSGADVVTMELRRARQAAVDQRRVYRIFFLNETVRLDRLEIEGNWTRVSDIFLPQGVEFSVPDGGAMPAEQTPDGLGASGSIDFNGNDWVLFQPDGSARDGIGRLANGIVYLTQTDDPSLGRAVTLFGATGRVRPWRLTEGEGEAMVWQ